MINATRGTTVDTICSRIIQELKGGRWRPGDRLVAHTLADSYQVSRTPVREALIRLEKEGYVTGTANAGFEPRTPSLEELCELYELRELLEGFAVEKLAANGISPELLEKLRRLARQRCVLQANADYEAAGEADQAFHQLICNSCHSSLIQKVLHNYLELSVIFKANSVFYFLQRRPLNDGSEHDAIDDAHDAIIEAMAAGKSKLSRKLMEQHIRDARKVFEKELLRQRKNER